MISVFIATSKKFECINWLTEYSIRRNTDADVRIHVLTPKQAGMQPSGCTGFTNMRFAVPQLCREYGYEAAVYADCDMIFLADVAELWQYRITGKWAVLEDGSNEVSIIDASLKYPDKSVLHLRHKGTLPRGDQVPVIPSCWNVEDRVEPGMKLLHFTALKHQPWFYEHPCKEAVEIYRAYESDYRGHGAESWPCAAAAS